MINTYWMREAVNTLTGLRDAIGLVTEESAAEDLLWCAVQQIVSAARTLDRAATKLEAAHDEQNN